MCCFLFLHLSADKTKTKTKTKFIDIIIIGLEESIMLKVFYNYRQSESLPICLLSVPQRTREFNMEMKLRAQDVLVKKHKG